MEAIARAFPYLATIVVGAAHAIAWRSQSTYGTWIALGAAWVALAALALLLLRREEMLGESMQLKPGDVSRGIGGAAVAVVFLFFLGMIAVKVAPMRAFEELRALIFVATRVPVEWKRALIIVALAACEEIVFRGAVSVFLEARVGSVRAPWIASGLYALAAVPSLHPGVIAAAVAIGAVTAFLVSRFRRVVVAIVAHAAFAWLAVEFVLPALWQKLLVPPP